MESKTVVVATKNELKGVRGLRDYCVNRLMCEECPFESICDDLCAVDDYMGRLLEILENKSEEE